MPWRYRSYTADALVRLSPARSGLVCGLAMVTTRSKSPTWPVTLHTDLLSRRRQGPRPKKPSLPADRKDAQYRITVYRSEALTAESQVREHAPTPQTRPDRNRRKSDHSVSCVRPIAPRHHKDMDIDEEMRVMRQKEREADQTQYNARLEELQKERAREQEVLSSRFEELAILRRCKPPCRWPWRVATRSKSPTWPFTKLEDKH